MSIPELTGVVKREIADYSGEGIRSISYGLFDPEHQIYAVVDVPDVPRPFPPALILMVRIEGDKIIIDEDIHDRPFADRLIKAGVPREKIVVIPSGEE